MISVCGDVSTIICSDFNCPCNLVLGQAHDFKRIKFTGNTTATHDFDKCSATAQIVPHRLCDFVRSGDGPTILSTLGHIHVAVEQLGRYIAPGPVTVTTDL